MHAPHSDACESSFAIACVISLWSLHEDYDCYWRQQSLHLLTFISWIFILWHALKHQTQEYKNNKEESVAHRIFFSLLLHF